MQRNAAGASRGVSQQVPAAIPASRALERLHASPPHGRAIRLFTASGVLAMAALGFAGCDSVTSLPARVQERFEEPQPRLRLYPVEQKRVFEAAQRTLKRLDFIVSRAGAASGTIKAHSPLRSTAAFGKARQYSFEVHVQTLDGETQVAAVLREQEESEAFAGATDIPLRQHGLYDSFFAELGRELGESGTEPGQPAAAR